MMAIFGHFVGLAMGNWEAVPVITTEQVTYIFGSRNDGEEVGSPYIV